MDENNYFVYHKMIDKWDDFKETWKTIKFNEELN